MRCEALLAVPGVTHAFSTRRADGSDSFDLGTADPPDAAVSERRERFLAAAGFGGRRATILRQVHGATVVRAQAAGPPPLADSSVWLREDGDSGIPSVRSADCVPILLAHRAGRGAAAVHAGWRGTAERAVVRALEELAAEGVRPQDCLAALGPAIRACCYEVEWEVADAVRSACGTQGAAAVVPGAGRPRLDLHEANRIQLRDAGVPCDSIHAASWCTCCRPDLFFSHRRDGAAAGRMMASIGGALARS